MEAVTETLLAGDSYQQSADEVHSSHPTQGAISIITRRVVYPDGSANIFYPEGSTWTSAEARDAKLHEIKDGTRLALAQLNQEIT